MDAQTADYARSAPWGRCLTVLEAKIIEADPQAAEARWKAGEAEQFVSLGACNPHGLRTVIAKGNAGGRGLLHRGGRPHRRSPGGVR